MNSKFFLPTKKAEDWGSLLVDDKQWQEGHSARSLALSWQEANGFPDCIQKVFSNSEHSFFLDVKFLFGFPEYKVELPGGKRQSQNDIYVIAKARNELFPIMVEGKVSEPFDKKVKDWLGTSPSKGKVERLNYLLKILGLNYDEVKEIKYQLLHRTVSALVEAEKLNAKNALILIHSFSQTYRWFDDYGAFIKLFGINPIKDKIVGPKQISRINTYFAWVKGDARFLN